MKGVFIPEITVETLKSASLEAIEDFFSAILDGEATIFDTELPTWIPCSVMLPDGGTECLITVDGKHETWDERTLNYYHVQVAMFTKDLYKIDDCKFYDRKGKTGFYAKNDEGCYHEVEYVTAWMPLPDPYREDGEQNG